MSRVRFTAILTAGAVVVAWAGMAAHDVFELRALVPASPQFMIPSAIYLALGALLVLRRSAASRRVLAGWVALNLVGGGVVSLLPLPSLPWVPEQWIAHYAVHLVYAATQLPALWLLARRSTNRVRSRLARGADVLTG